MHESLYGTPHQHDAVAYQLPPHLARPIDLVVVMPDTLNVSAHQLEAQRPDAAKRWIAPSSRMAPVRGRSDRHRLADRLDPESLVICVDERVEHLLQQSSSAWSKNAQVGRSISI